MTMQSSVFGRIKISNIPQEFIDEYDLTKNTCDGWVYLEILKGCYGLPQDGKTSNDILRICLRKTRYYEVAMTLGIWRHKWHPICFRLIVDEFVIEYVGERHSQHLLHTFQKHYTITTDWEGGGGGGGLRVFKLIEHMLTSTLSASDNYPRRGTLTKFFWNMATQYQLTLNSHSTNNMK